MFAAVLPRSGWGGAMLSRRSQPRVTLPSGSRALAGWQQPLAACSGGSRPSSWNVEPAWHQIQGFFFSLGE